MGSTSVRQNPVRQVCFQQKYFRQNTVSTKNGFDKVHFRQSSFDQSPDSTKTDSTKSQFDKVHFRQNPDSTKTDSTETRFDKVHFRQNHIRQCLFTTKSLCDFWTKTDSTKSYTTTFSYDKSELI